MYKFFKCQVPRIYREAEPLDYSFHTILKSGPCPFKIFALKSSQYYIIDVFCFTAFTE